MKRVTVALADRSYDVVVGSGAVSALSSLIPPGVKRVAIVTQSSIPFSVDPGSEHKVFTIGAGEQHKTLATIETLCRDFASWGMNRADCVISSYMRGIPVVHVATTLLAMIDAAIGGKTGVNLPEGKNMVGAFWQPHGVICDLSMLDTLPERERLCGFGEMAKYHFLTGDDLLALSLEDRIARCVQIKAEVVGLDERESISSDNKRGRALLNYGHTFAHALEIATDHALLHGEAVAIGLVYAARLAVVMGRVSADVIDHHLHVLEEYGLDGRLPTDLTDDALLALMARDKKAIDGLTFILDGPTGIEVVAGVPVAAVREALGEMRRV
jgi:5-deoxy-5-amino-3-dehydroquinate synthase